MEYFTTAGAVAAAQSFMAEANDENLWVVAFGGFLGGALQPVVAKLNPKSPDPTTENFLLAPLLGVAAAGISIYALANSKTDDVMHLLFFALLCGLAFPAVLSSAVDNIGRNTAQVQSEVAQIAEQAKSEDKSVNAEAADALRTTLVRNPPDTVKPEGAALIEQSAREAVTNIAQTPVETPAEQRELIEELREVGVAAKTVGWNLTAQTAADELRKLSDSIDDAPTSAAATDAADRLSS